MKKIFIIFNSLLLCTLIIFIILNIIIYNNQKNIMNTYKNENELLTTSINKVMDENYLSMAQLIKYINFSKNIPLIWPIKESLILKDFGLNDSKKYKFLDLNPGIVIMCKKGEEVISTASGRVDKIFIIENNNPEHENYTDVDYVSKGYVVEISHDFEFKTVYSNLEKVNVQEGDMVEKGKVLGSVNKNNNIPFLFYQIKFGKKFLHPNLFFL